MKGEDMADYYERQVVLCKDCRWRGTFPEQWLDDGCRWFQEEEPDDEDFCSYGELRKDEDDAGSELGE